MRYPSILSSLAISAITLANAPALAQNCTVTSCQTISAPGNYCAPPGTVINMPNNGDCIIIASTGVVFAAQSLTINGPFFPQGGTAIHIQSRATGAQVNLTGSTSIGLQTTGGVNVGILDAASNTTIVLSGGIQADAMQGSQSGYGVILQNSNNSTIAMLPDPALGGSGISGDIDGLLITGGSHNTVVSGYDLFGDGWPAGVIQGSQIAGVHILNSQHNLINHIEASGEDSAILLDTASGNTIYNNFGGAQFYGVRATWRSPNNVILRNRMVGADGYDLFQGTQRNTAGCNGDYWANNVRWDGSPATTNQPCVTAQQSISAY